MSSDLGLSTLSEAAQLGLTDPIFFFKTFLPHLFGGDPPETPKGRPAGRIPWVHRGLVAIVLRKTSFLWTYGEVAKIMAEFVITRPHVKGADGHPKVLGYIFRVFHRTTGAELDHVAVARLEKEQTPAELDAEYEIALHVGQHTLIMMPRGSAKTTIVGQAIPVYSFCYGLHKLIAYISETGTHAEMQANNIRSELSGNHMLLEAFGVLAPDRTDSNHKWSERLFETLNGSAMATRGRGAQIRGLNNKGNRPSLMLWDDLEDKDSVATPEQRKKTLVWAFGDAIPALPKVDKNASIVAIGTMLDKECLLNTLAKNPDWTPITFGVVDRAGKLLWPEMMNWEELDKERKAYAREGLSYLFYLEYFNLYIPGNLQEFKREYFKFEVPDLADIVGWAIWCDPAIGEKRTNDRAVIQVGGMLKDGRVYMAAEKSRRGEPNMVKVIVEDYFELCKLFHPVYHGFESNAFQKALGSLLTHAMPKNDYYFEPIPIAATRAKTDRIMGNVQPRLSSGFIIWHPSFENGETMQEMLSYNPAVKDQADDGPDCTSGVLDLLKPLNPFVAGELKDVEPVEDEDELPLDVVMGGDWRSY